MKYIVRQRSYRRPFFVSWKFICSYNLWFFRRYLSLILQFFISPAANIICKPVRHLHVKHSSSVHQVGWFKISRSCESESESVVPCIAFLMRLEQLSNLIFLIAPTLGIWACQDECFCWQGRHIFLRQSCVPNENFRNAEVCWGKEKSFLNVPGKRKGFHLSLNDNHDKAQSKMSAKDSGELQP